MVFKPKIWMVKWTYKLQQFLIKGTGYSVSYVRPQLGELSDDTVVDDLNFSDENINFTDVVNLLK